MIHAAMADREGYDRLAYLCYRIGNRLSGSPALERAIAWSVEQMKAVGLSNVRVIPTKVPHWVRNSESAKMITPLEKAAAHVGTRHECRNPARRHHGGHRGRLQFRRARQTWAATRCRVRSSSTTTWFTNYGSGRNYRSSGASRAASLGAVGVLVRLRHAARHAAAAYRRYGVRSRAAQDSRRRHHARRLLPMLARFTPRVRRPASISKWARRCSPMPIAAT
ncbi:MAG: hypothetical protein WDO73_04285 [Ignavibacteriota bacterium]